jgi:hypothetical protein
MKKISDVFSKYSKEIEEICNDLIEKVKFMEEER